MCRGGCNEYGKKTTFESIGSILENIDKFFIDSHLSFDTTQVQWGQSSASMVYAKCKRKKFVYLSLRNNNFEDVILHLFPNAHIFANIIHSLRNK